MSTTAVEKGLQFEKAIVDMLKAGYDLWTNQDVEGYLEVGKSDAERGDYFLRVVGDNRVGRNSIYTIGWRFGVQKTLGA